MRQPQWEKWIPISVWPLCFVAVVVGGMLKEFTILSYLLILTSVAATYKTYKDWNVPEMEIKDRRLILYFYDRGKTSILLESIDYVLFIKLSWYWVRIKLILKNDEERELKIDKKHALILKRWLELQNIRVEGIIL